MMWRYEYRDKPRPCYRILDGSDDGDVAECWDEDVARIIVDSMNAANEPPKQPTAVVVAARPREHHDCCPYEDGFPCDCGVVA